MSSDDERIVVGRSDVKWSKPHTLIFSFHDFPSIPTQKNFCSKTRSLRCFDRAWHCQLYPGGDNKGFHTPGNISVFLHVLREPDGVNTNLMTQFTVRNPISSFERSYTKEFTPDNDSFGSSNFALRQDVVDRYLDEEGTLTLEVDIRLYQGSPNQGVVDLAPAWTPSKTLGEDMLQLLESETFADANFCVGDQNFRAHRNVLASRAPMLLELIADVPAGSTIELDDVDPPIFHALLRFLYAEKMPSLVFLQEHAHAMIRAADRFGCVRFKLVTQVKLVHSGIISVENAADFILFADAQNCALLKEAAMDFFVSNSSGVMASDGWSRVKESNELLLELIEAITKKPTGSEDGVYDSDGMRVAALWRKLDERGLDLDGSREMLLQRLAPSDDHDDDDDDNDDDDKSDTA